jgi:hypothetical protein
MKFLSLFLAMVCSNEVDPELPHGEKVIYFDFGDPLDNINFINTNPSGYLAGFPMVFVEVGIFNNPTFLWMSFQEQ